MSELPFTLSEEDVRAYNRDIGLEAAFVVNAVVTSTGETYDIVQQQIASEELAPHIARLAVQAEDTVDRHIGRRSENDDLFAAQTPKDMPKTLELFTTAGAEALLSDSELERRTSNKERLMDGIAQRTEPLINALRDKLPVPQALVEKRRWGKNKQPRMPHNHIQDWEQQDADATTHSFKLYYIENNGDQQLRYFSHCAKRAGNCGAISSMRLRDNQVTSISYGDYALENRLPADFSEHLTIKHNPFSLWNVSLEIENGVHTLSVPLAHPNGYDNVHTNFIYSEDSDLFVHQDDRYEPLKPATVFEILDAMVAAFPTVDFTSNNRVGK